MDREAGWGKGGSASLAVGVIGQSLAQARGLSIRHAIKQVGRRLSSQAIVAWDLAARWVPDVIGSATDVTVARDELRCGWPDDAGLEQGDVA